ncbi:hypothetical protein [Aquihabitans sp. McL0605]|uniref:hypothetical protein n=1 Tax=Aquihabitans sp. McL0605 TaxID=3415671 RepID=UPI003CEA82BF
MIHLRDETTTPPVDVATLAAAIPLLLDQHRSLDIDADGVLPRPGPPRRAGLRVLRGTHPHPGTTYQLVGRHTWEHEGKVQQRVTLTDIELLADSAELVQLRGREVGLKTTVLASLVPGIEPRTLTIELSGPVDITVEIDLGLVDRPVPQVEATLLHRWAAAEAAVAIAVAPDGRWRWDVRVDARGRSLARPVAAVGALVARRRIRAEFRRAVIDAISEAVDALGQLLAQISEPGATPEANARMVVDALVAGLPLEVPPPPDLLNGPAT